MNNQELRDTLRGCNYAAVPVVNIQTYETTRCLEWLKDAVYPTANTVNFLQWTVTTGWSQAGNKAINNTKDPLQAMRYILDESSNNTAKTLAVMLYPHFVIGENGVAKQPAVVATLRELIDLLPNTMTRLVLLTPPSFKIPPELKNDISSFEFFAPDANERAQYIQSYLSCIFDPPDIDADTLKEANSLLAGMHKDEILNAFGRALYHANHSADGVADGKVNQDCLLATLRSIKTEAVKNNDVLELLPPINMATVGGLDNLKQWVARRAHAFSAEAKMHGVDAPKGIALFGPPGTGKSLSAQAIASTLRLPLIKFDVSRVFGSLVGASESKIRETLSIVSSMAPCVLFIDEIDKVFDIRSGSGDSGVSQRVLGTILSWMNDAQGIFTVITGNRVDGLPAELLRKGRLDEVFAVLLPNPVEREEIIKIHIAKRGKTLPDTFDMGAVVTHTENFAASEIEAVVKEAILSSFIDKVDLTAEMMIDAALDLKPLYLTHKEQFETMASWAETNARAASSPCPTVNAENASGYNTTDMVQMRRIGE